MRFLFIVVIYFLFNSFLFGSETDNIRAAKRSASNKYALVIGNSNYIYSGKLKNPINDATDIAEKLQKLGFNVELLIDAKLKQIDQSILNFGKKLSKNDVGLFYYAGHGVQLNGENFLVPIEANPQTENDFKYDSYPIGKLINQLEATKNRTNIIILDACRNNPFTLTRNFNSRGLAQINATQGTFISYATAPGQVAIDGKGNNSVFTKALLENIETPGIKIEELFKIVRQQVIVETTRNQTPWDSSSLVDEFYFNTEDEERKKREDEERKKREDELELKQKELEFIEDSKRIKLENSQIKTPPKVIFDSQSNTKTKLSIGYQSNTLALEIKLDGYKEEINSSGLSFEIKYFINRNIGLNFFTSTGNVNSLDIEDPNSPEISSLNATGSISSSLFGINYNWGGYSDSIFGDWWVLGVGIGFGSTNSTFTDSLTENDYTISVSGIGLNLNVEYRTTENWIFGLNFYSVQGNASGSRVEYLQEGGKEVSVSSSIVSLSAGYQF